MRFMNEYKIYDGEIYWRRDKYLAEVMKLRGGIIKAKFKGKILRVQKRRIKRKVEKLIKETELLKKYEIEI